MFRKLNGSGSFPVVGHYCFSAVWFDHDGVILRDLPSCSSVRMLSIGVTTLDVKLTDVQYNRR